ncbi:hypothetical protein SUGI_0075200 [Cryptomeria japonica]|uniref:uncharacterized protein LOC131039779 n=1 Tax=Cryptomeria japonica TaxID=3369 RepID=UPI002408EA5D|nr:uncharacterized protein LOC131039779 [Cryptomeria japonica]GLJ07836.1 hypothetical protein SUGI_0075200 [Cryptomeria japonica]
MSGVMKKRSREEESLENSPKRFHGRTEEQNLHTLEDFELAEDFQETEEKCSVSEEAVSEVLRGLEEEIGVMSSSTSDQGLSGSSREDDYSSLASDMTSGYGASEGSIDLCYLVGASDDELGIPPTPLFSSEDHGGQAGFPSEEDDSGFSSDFVENGELKGFLEKWHFEDDFVDCAQFSFIEHAAASAWDDVVSQGLFVDEDYSQSWGLETAGDL